MLAENAATRTSNASPMGARRVLPGVLPLLLLPLAAWSLTRPLSPWILMWGLALSIYGGLKWVTWWRARRLVRGSPLRSAAYLLLWPGMDAPAFLGSRRRVRAASRSELLGAGVSVALGAVLFWGLARRIEHQPIVAGWIGLLGLVLLLHFGAFRLVSICWRRVGVDAMPLMRAPLAAASLGELWGRRWNTAFHVLARDFVVAPVQPRLGIALATMVAFLASGLVHDLVISVPARGGFGLPTAYFLLQGLGLLLERSKPGRALGLGRGFRGRTFTLAVAGAPVLVLFHAPFVLKVIVPFMQAMGAL